MLMSLNSSTISSRKDLRLKKLFYFSCILNIKILYINNITSIINYTTKIWSIVRLVSTFQNILSHKDNIPFPPIKN